MCIACVLLWWLYLQFSLMLGLLQLDGICKHDALHFIEILLQLLLLNGWLGNGCFYIVSNCSEIVIICVCRRGECELKWWIRLMNLRLLCYRIRYGQHCWNTNQCMLKLNFKTKFKLQGMTWKIVSFVFTLTWLSMLGCMFACDALILRAGTEAIVGTSLLWSLSLELFELPLATVLDTSISGAIVTSRSNLTYQFKFFPLIINYTLVLTFLHLPCFFFIQIFFQKRNALGILTCCVFERISGLCLAISCCCIFWYVCCKCRWSEVDCCNSVKSSGVGWICCNSITIQINIFSTFMMTIFIFFNAIFLPYGQSIHFQSAFLALAWPIWMK